MADAIPVNSESKKPQRKVNVQPSPTLDENGVVTQGDYVAKIREGIGEAADFQHEPVSTSERETNLDVAKVVNGAQVIETHTHRFTRVDN